jgi:hypothetical protein
MSECGGTSELDSLHAMSKRAAIFLAVSALIIGVLAGGWSVAFYYNRVTSWVVITKMTSEATISVAELEMLRAGQATNTMELLETTIDGDLVGLSPFLTDRREFNRYPSNIKALQTVKDYRAKFPRKTDSAEFDANAAKAFDLLDGQTKH